jgi:hypothetical protein
MAANHTPLKSGQEFHIDQPKKMVFSAVHFNFEISKATRE